MRKEVWKNLSLKYISMIYIKQFGLKNTNAYVSWNGKHIDQYAMEKVALQKFTNMKSKSLMKKYACKKIHQTSDLIHMVKTLVS